MQETEQRCNHYGIIIRTIVLLFPAPPPKGSGTLVHIYQQALLHETGHTSKEATERYFYWNVLDNALLPYLEMYNALFVL